MSHKIIFKPQEPQGKTYEIERLGVSVAASNTVWVEDFHTHIELRQGEEDQELRLSFKQIRFS